MRIILISMLAGLFCICLGASYLSAPHAVIPVKRMAAIPARPSLRSQALEASRVLELQKGRLVAMRLAIEGPAAAHTANRNGNAAP